MDRLCSYDVQEPFQVLQKVSCGAQDSSRSQGSLQCVSYADHKVSECYALNDRMTQCLIPSSANPLGTQPHEYP
ncbi:hypothetical protein FGO68_gene14681 [Halteria grandinella]|uniref:Uncharacterized protein n=1 Tax=Halteria grandinella TaxID=5974 RepID=A0A8J8P0Q8_HALGN|nr:hypothetical protein FGO68_gene14681 [Halteria grandinella]